MKRQQDTERLRAEKLNNLLDQLVCLGLDGAHFSKLLETFCLEANAMGIAIMRAHVTLRATHPEFGGIAHGWERGDGTHFQAFQHVYSPTQEWVQSPLYYLLENDVSEIRQRLTVPDPALSFPLFDDLRARGATDYVAFKVFFNRPDGTLAVDPNATPEGCLLSLSCDGPDGYTDADLKTLRQVIPILTLALKSEANRQTAADIADTYLGRDAGGHVLSGDILRGSLRSIDAVICYFDLSGFTKLSETLPGRAVVDMLNDYFEMAVDAVQEYGGNVLKFMGDGMLAIFNREVVSDARLSAIESTVALRDGMAIVSNRRTSEGKSTTDFTVALHAGQVLYGNIGGKTRLDFTVIGPAVNTAARLSGMCAHVDQKIVISAEIARDCLDRRPDLVSLGQYRLRGVAARQELYTLDEAPLGTLQQI